MFIIGGLGYLIPAIIFCVFGSAKIQKWNEIVTIIERQDKTSNDINSSHLAKAPTGNDSIDNEQTKL